MHGRIDAEGTTLGDLLSWRAQTRGQSEAYIFLKDGESVEEVLTYEALDQRARAIAAFLQAHRIEPGSRALLLYQPGSEYIAAFFGCLHSGVVAVPAYPPLRNKHSFERLLAIVHDSQASAILTTTHFLEQERFSSLSPADLPGIQWLATDQEDLIARFADAWLKPSLDTDHLALLQYTSGSTATPKGVMISHKNLLHNLALIQRCCEHTAQSHGVTWAPPYHDMGLVGGVLQPVYGGFPLTYMSPFAFLQRPLRWLQALSDTKGTTSGGPNFAYELCVRKISLEECMAHSLDLSHWSLAFCSAEPVHYPTLERFADMFAAFGFRREAFYPCYGLAESTLLVSGGQKHVSATVRHFDRVALSKNKAEPATETDNIQTLVSNGRPLPGYELLVVDPQTHVPCAPGDIGEIWIKGPCVARGYWRQPDETERSFKASPDGWQARDHFLRSGDLGFLFEGEVFLTGRLKDLIILRGRNYYPQDIEQVVGQAHPAFLTGAGAAFSVDVSGEERLVVIHEISRHYVQQEKGALIDAVRRSLSENLGLQAYAVVLLKPASLPRTTSGKVQRYACKKAFQEQNFEPLAREILHAAENAARPAEDGSDWLTPRALLSLDPDERQDLLEAFLQQEVARLLGQPSAAIGLLRPLSNLGLDSLIAVELKNRVEIHCSALLPLSAILQGRSIRELAREIAAQLHKGFVLPSLPQQDTTLAEQAFSLSYDQQALWFGQQMAPEAAVYNIARSMRVRGELQLAVWQRVLQQLAARHEMLRTRFVEIDGVPQQTILPSQHLDFDVQDAADWDDSRLYERVMAEAWRPFRLTQEPLWRVRLFARSDHEYILLFVIHHIIVDFWSMAVLIDEFFRLYTAEIALSAVELPPVLIQYRDYVHRQDRLLKEPALEEQWRYWQEQLAGSLPHLKLPLEKKRSVGQSFKSATHTFEIDAQRIQQLRGLAQSEQVTLYMLLLAAFQVLLYRYTGQEDMLVGSPTSGRHHAHLNDLVGYLVHPVVLRTNLAGSAPFRKILHQVRHVVLGAFEHLDVPFSLLVQRLQPVRDTPSAPFFQAMFVLQKVQPLNMPEISSLVLGLAQTSLSVADLQVDMFPLEQPFTEFDLLLTVVEDLHKAQATLQYRVDVYEPLVMGEMARHFQILLESIVASPDRPVETLALLTLEARQHFIANWNGQRLLYPRDQCVCTLFEHQVNATPDAVALSCGSEQLTYTALHRHVALLAGHLSSFTLPLESAIGLCIERSPDLIIALLAILKAGYAYVPLDPHYPLERLDYIVKDAHVALVVTESSVKEKLARAWNLPMLCLDEQRQTVPGEEPSAQGEQSKAENLAYIMYTSGSTGRPKGIGVTHRNIVRLVKENPYVQFQQEVFLQFAPISFDASTFEIWGCLLNGSRLVMAPPELLSVEDLGELLRRFQVTTLWLSAGIFHQMLEQNSADLRGLHQLLAGGEALSVPHVRKALLELPGVRLINGYGPTEGTTFTCCHRINSQDLLDTSVPIGKAIAHTQAYVLDSQMLPAPVGIPGELYIGGDGLARGYLHDPMLTADRFLPHPFSTLPGERLYKTGDIVCHSPDGTLVFLGRGDHQVKIRGFRVEPEEVAAILRQYPDIRNAVVMSERDSAGTLSLVAYLACSPERAPSIQAVRAFLKRVLPDFMLPARLYCVPALPLTSNGKVDYRILQALNAQPLEDNQDLVAPRTPLEQVIAGIWADTLKTDQMGVFQNFFELGGHSLLALQIVAQLRAVFPLELPLVALFQRSTVASLAEYIDEAGRTAGIDVSQIACLLLELNALSDLEIQNALEQSAPD